MMSNRRSLLRSRPGSVSKSLIGAVALVLVAGLGVFYFAGSGSKTAAAKALPVGRVISVGPIKGYEPALTNAEKDLLRTGPDAKDKASVKRYLLAKAKFQPDPLMRRQLEQEAIILTDGYGRTPPITADNPQVRSAGDALMNHNHPERLNPRIAPASFDAAAYAANPQAYLNVSEPGRVFQSAPAGANVVQIQPVSPYYQDVKQGDSIDLMVKAAPGYPVTFTSFDCGAFGNGLTTQTVEADSAGIATVKFLGVPGTVLESNILAASPMTSGQVRFKANTLVYVNGQQVAVK